MRLLIIGHSYVNALQRTGITRFVAAGINIEVSFVHRGGADYNTYLTDRNLFDQIKRHNPDFVIVILAGNAIKGSNSNDDIREQGKRFYTKLREIFPEGIVKIVAAQVEPRFYEPENRWNCPLEDEYKRRKTGINTFLARLKLKDHILMVGGPYRLDNRDLYRNDGVHLNQRGLDKYWELIEKEVQFLITGPI